MEPETEGPQETAQPEPRDGRDAPAPRDMNGLVETLVAAEKDRGGATEKDRGGAAEKDRGGKRMDLDPDTVERDLVKLVLTIIELLRQLMERQAVRRFDTGDLTEDQEERIGLTLMLLEDRMAELRDRYGLKPEDLNLDLGPLGPLLPRE
ncbi:gas vesicle protein K [Streptomyces alfalfae]|uniref:gas vesicle protein K n=1 Tax=Streptomyces alfalfae TaxID=1642299 RepID=UPI001FD08B80|nr:gas vesicle protein K [Streptomyces alfalfae]